MYGLELAVPLLLDIKELHVLISGDQEAGSAGSEDMLCVVGGWEGLVFLCNTSRPSGDEE